MRSTRCPCPGTGNGTSTSGAKSDAGDAKVLADLVRTDRHQHRPVAGDSELAEAVKVLARTHQNLIWSRQRQANLLRSTLREFYPTSSRARAYYDTHRARGHTHHQALRALANRLVGILHGCLRHRQDYDEATAWPPAEDTQLPAAA